MEDILTPHTLVMMRSVLSKAKNLKPSEKGAHVAAFGAMLEFDMIQRSDLRQTNG